MSDLPTRGERNNNPGNLNFIDPAHGGHPFDGQTGLETLPPGASFAARFGRYDTPFHGIRALAEQLLIDEQKKGFHTPLTIIACWAPSVDGNDVQAYAAALAKACGVTTGSPIDLELPGTLQAATRAIIVTENRRDAYGLSLITAACDAALRARGVIP